MLKKFISLAAAIICLFLVFSGCQKKQDNTKNLSNYAITADFNEKERVINSKMNFEYYNNTTKEINYLKFNLFANAYRKDAKFKPISDAYKSIAYFNGESFGGMDILKVTKENKDIPFEIVGVDKNILQVNLPKSVYPKDTAEIKIEFTVKVPQTLHRLGYTYKTVNICNWFPILCANDENGFYECEYYSLGDPFYSECANYDVTFSCDNSYILASSGDEIEKTINDDKTFYRLTSKAIRDFAIVLSKEFKVISEDVLGTKINYFYYNKVAEDDKSFQIAKESFEYFYKKFGAYPYKTLNIVQSGFCYSGMEYPRLTIISDKLKDTSQYDTIVHENAHQWWYGLVGNNQLEESWLDEGLSDYSTLLFFEEYGEYGVDRNALVNTAMASYKFCYNVIKQLHGETNTTMNRKLKDFLSEYEYVNIAYNKGMLLFDTLRIGVGEKKFYKGLKNYFNQNCYKIVGYENLIGCFEKIGSDTNGFFYSWIDGKILI